MSATTTVLRRGRRPRLPPPDRTPGLTRSAILVAATRVLHRRGARGLLWSQIAREAGTRSLALQRRFADLAHLVYECHDRSAASLESALLRAETAGGIGRDRLAVFLRAALAARREHGAYLPPARAQGLPPAGSKGLREREAMLRARLERLMLRGEKDGSLACPDREAAIELVLAALYQPPSGRSALRRAEADAAIAELLLRAVAGDVAGRAVSARASSARPHR
jgi:AcrR family transcriptional regulator